ncbi:MAG: signal peptidase I [Anaerovoracaceae bacterium]|nr:signal peptidase I [Bacillota bacterium]MDY2670672.1 signal peptidase I [Anaerovoracaceae bacterium]
MDDNLEKDRLQHDVDQPEDTEKNDDGKKSAGREVFAWVRDIAIAVVIALVISYFVTPTIVQEHSMENTLHNNDYLILWKAAYKFGGEPQYGDIVVFKSHIVNEQNGRDKLLIKRVIAKGGDTVAIRDGVVYRNGEALDEPYTKDGFTNGGMDETVVPDGELFLCGDNRIVSLDSRSPEVGFVDEKSLVGKAVCRLFPFNSIGGIYKNLPDADKADK